MSADPSLEGAHGGSASNPDFAAISQGLVKEWLQVAALDPPVLLMESATQTARLSDIYLVPVHQHGVLSILLRRWLALITQCCIKLRCCITYSLLPKVHRMLQLRLPGGLVCASEVVFQGHL